MTTYTLNGFAIQEDGDQIESFAESRLEVVVPEGTSTFSVTRVGVASDGLGEYELNFDEYYTAIDGVDTDGGQFDNIELGVYTISNGDVSFEAALVYDFDTDKLYLFKLAGLVPTSIVSSPAALEAFIAGASVVDVPSGTSYTFADIPGIEVTENDFVGGNSAAELVDGGAGDDTLMGGGGDDTLRGGADNDMLNGGNGDDLIIPGSNTIHDDITGSAGNDTIVFTGAEGDDDYGLGYVNLGAVTVDIDAGANTGSVTKTSGTDTLVDVVDPMTTPDGGLSIETGTGDDVFNVTSVSEGYISLRGHGGNDTFNLTLDDAIRLDYRGGSTGILADLAAGTIADGRGGIDTVNVLGGDARLQLRGTDHADDITGSDRDEAFILEEGNDTLDGGAGVDLLRYDRAGVDAVTVDLAAGTATGTWFGSGFTDSISNIEAVRGSHEGDDRLTGDSAANHLRGMGGNDTLTGGAGNDTLVGDAGNDTAVLGVARADATVTATAAGFQIVSAEGTDQLEGIEFVQFADGNVAAADLVATDPGTPGTPGDLIIGTDDDDTLTGTDGDDVIAGGGGSDSLDGGEGNDNISGSDGNDSIDGGPGNDSLGGGLGDDILTGSAGNDVIGGGQGNDVVLGNDGNDLLAGGPGDDTLFGGEGNDNIGASFGNDSVDGNGGNDSLGGGTGRDTLDGGAGNDNIGGGEGDDVVDGGAGDDFLAGGGRNDVIDGGTGDDVINGGDGDDTMTGGAGEDVFVFNGFNDGDADVITDWTNGEDSFRMTGIENAPGSGLAGKLDALNITDTAEGAQMSYQGHVIVLSGVAAADLGLEDFTFL